MDKVKSIFIALNEITDLLAPSHVKKYYSNLW